MQGSWDQKRYTRLRLILLYPSIPSSSFHSFILFGLAVHQAASAGDLSFEVRSHLRRLSVALRSIEELVALLDRDFRRVAVVHGTSFIFVAHELAVYPHTLASRGSQAVITDTTRPLSNTDHSRKL